MAQAYIQAANIGEGFITHEDQVDNGLSFVGHPADVWTVKGTKANIDAWMKRVGGTRMAKAKAQASIDAFMKSAAAEAKKKPIDDLPAGMDIAAAATYKLP